MESRQSLRVIAVVAMRVLPAKQWDAGADVSALEREIDELVYALYGLTPEEIRIVESASAKASCRRSASFGTMA